MPESPLDLTSSQTVLSGALGSSAFDHGRFAPGTVLAERYRIIGLLGRGGMGEVYRADDLTLGQSVALKFLPESVARDRGNLERLLSEVRTARQVSHPNVCRVHDVGEAAGRRFISMEYIDGEDLSVLLRRIGRLPANKCVEIARQLCAGLAASHERGVLHRDLKPANIMHDGRGRVRITDFGLGTALQTDGKAVGEFAGTPAYMAPEQLAGKPVSVQTDIYALGLVLYEIFTGKRFHNVRNLDELRERHAHDSISSLSSEESLLDPAVSRVIERCLESEPRRRPASCALVAASLPGGDPLAAAIAAGETPSPQLVAAAAVQGAIAPRTAVLLGALFVVALAGATVGNWSPPQQFGLGRSPEVLSAQTRDLLADLGYTDPPADTAAGFTYRYWVVRDPAIEQSPRPWSLLRAGRPSPVFFWYREQPSAMVQSEMGRFGLEALAFPLRGVSGVRATDPPFEPGSVYVELAPDGRLETLMARPRAGSTAQDSVRPAMDWTRLFAKAGLDMASFTPAEPEPALVMAGVQRLAWVTGGTNGATPLRVEASELAGRPVTFRVLSSRAPLEPGVVFPSLSSTSSAADRAGIVSIATLALAYVGMLYFMRCNLLLGRGDRRGAARLARVTGSLVFVASLLSASLRMENRLVGTLHGALAVGLFVGAITWAFYMAIEPFIRRQWPRMMVGWSRLMAGDWRDPQVGREVFLGVLSAMIAMAAISVVQNPLLLKFGTEPPLDGVFDFRALSGPAQLTSSLLQVVPYSVFISVLWMVLFLLLRRLLRSDIAAIVVLGFTTILMMPLVHWLPFLVAMLINVAVLLLIVRSGFLTLVANVVAAQVATSLPFAPGSPGFVGTLSWIIVLAITLPAMFGLYTALAGQSIFGGADES